MCTKIRQVYLQERCMFLKYVNMTSGLFGNVLSWAFTSSIFMKLHLKGWEGTSLLATVQIELKWGLFSHLGSKLICQKKIQFRIQIILFSLSSTKAPPSPVEIPIHLHISAYDKITYRLQNASIMTAQSEELNWIYIGCLLILICNTDLLNEWKNTNQNNKQ